jgi:uncharacterized protein YggE
MKRTLLFLGILTINANLLLAEPELKGTPTELAKYLSEVPKSVIVTGEAEVRVPANRAVLSLRVITENKSLREAMRANEELRLKLAEFFKAQGVSADRIQASKFSSTPKYGLFSDKAKSYRVENVMRIAVQDEGEFQAAASAVDKWAEVQFDGVEFEYADKERQKQNAIAKACQNAEERKKIYEEKLGLKLTAVAFGEGTVGQRNTTPANYALNRGLNSYVASGSDASSLVGALAIADTVSSFGEIVYTASVSVEYKPQPK